LSPDTTRGSPIRDAHTIDRAGQCQTLGELHFRDELPDRTAAKSAGLLTPSKFAGDTVIFEEGTDNP
jgi:hypothetical protein